jgi:deazaflavin-dependent oxidoreductase (nitroreductase family)
MGLGPVIGRHVLIITTKGRKSGLPRHTMTEFHILNDKIYVPCAFAPKADWYKNIVADPHVTVQTWEGPQSMTASRVTDDEELRTVYQFIRQRNQVMMDWYLESQDVRADPDDVVAHKERIYFIRFDPTTEASPSSSPPPLRVDLAWLWPLITVWAVSWQRRRWRRRVHRLQRRLKRQERRSP